jgi:hypothetical protein
MMDTLLLNPTSWDLLVDAKGNIAVASDPYSISQDVASALKTFLGEVYYNTDLGVPYFQSILGYTESASFIAVQLENAALTVPGIVLAQLTGLELKDRILTGTIKVTDENGITNNVTF